jgi:DNA-binding IscR family transcriptional regulator
MGSSLAQGRHTSPSNEQAKLAKAGLVKTTRGRSGSSRLARPAQKISLLDIDKATAAPPVFAVHSHPVECKCVVSKQHNETMVRVLNDSQAAFEAALARKKLGARQNWLGGE